MKKYAKSKISVDFQCTKSDKMPYIIYADRGSLIKKIDDCANNPENFSTTNIGEDIPYEELMSIICAFYHIEKKHNLYCWKYCVKSFLNL